jgi:hypothetical protein
MDREPAVAGGFYEYFEDGLRKQVEECFLKKQFGPEKLPAVNENGKRKIIGVVVPHAGFAYSGSIASNSYFHLASDGRPDTFIIIGPNHTGFGTPVSIMDEGSWKTPLGKVEIDSEISKLILKNSRIVKKDASAHFYEHSVEVQLPFLQYVYKTFKLVPICMLDQTWESCEDLGNSISESISEKNAVVIASSDFTHYQSNETAHRQDKKALDAIKKMDPLKFLEVVDHENISACGYGPIASMMIAAKKLGAESCEIIKYATSGDITNHPGKVVGYASVKVMR